MWLFLKQIFGNDHKSFWKTPTTPENICARFEWLYKQYHKSEFDNSKTLALQTNSKITGRYAVQGHNNYDKLSTYFGELFIQQSQTNIHARWHIGHTNQVHYGNGFVFENLLCINFSYSESNLEYGGTVLFEIANDYTFSGFWLERNFSGIGYEIAKLKNKLD